MKKKNKRFPSIYDDRHLKNKPALHLPQLPLKLACLFIGLLIIRCLNIFMTWHFTQKEITYHMGETPPNITFAGFSFPQDAQNKFHQQINQNSTQNVLYYYYDLLHPLCCLVNNTGKGLFVDMGTLAIHVPAGQTTLSILPSEIVHQENDNRENRHYFGNSILKPVFKSIAAYLQKKSPNHSSPPSISFIKKPLPLWHSLFTPYTIYFFLPLLVLILMGLGSNQILWAGFVYFVEAFFLFDYRLFFVHGPFNWFFKLANINPSPTFSWIMAMSLFSAFLFFTLIGLLYLKKSRTSQNRWLILFFTLLPFSLRF